MKARTALLVLVVCLFAVAIYAADSPYMGTWKLNEAKSKIAAGSGKNTTVVYAVSGDSVKVTTDGVDGSGKATHSEWTGKFDGKDYAVTGDPNVDMRSAKQVNERTLEIANKKDGKVVSTAKSEIAKDGKSRELTSHVMVNGKKVENHYAYDKQ